jgi:hypothetical protein
MRLCVPALLSFLSGFAPAAAQTNCYVIGNQMKCADGQTYQIYGNPGSGGGSPAPSNQSEGSSKRGVAPGYHHYGGAQPYQGQAGTATPEGQSPSSGSRALTPGTQPYIADDRGRVTPGDQSADGQGGKTWTNYGNQIYGPGGRVCNRVGNQLYCN